MGLGRDKIFIVGVGWERFENPTVSPSIARLLACCYCVVVIMFLRRCCCVPGGFSFVSMLQCSCVLSGFSVVSMLLLCSGWLLIVCILQHCMQLLWCLKKPLQV